ncbi:hypothetical protein C8R46DRAFT_1064657 [Mycena filopes]|nr:hypothetical protein C8R46DRAFT_1064657 [Mycena filopes]
MSASSANRRTVHDIVKGVRNLFKWRMGGRIRRCGNVFTYTMPPLPKTRIDIRQLPMVVQPDTCYLLQLPLELRQRIYEDLLGGRLIRIELLPGEFEGVPASILPSYYTPDDDLARGAVPIDRRVLAADFISPQLLRSCRQVYIEALPVLHQRNTFHLPADHLATVVDGALGSYCLPDIRSVYLECNIYPQDGPPDTVVPLLRRMGLRRLAFEMNLQRLEMWYPGDQDIVQRFRTLMIGSDADEKYKDFLEEQGKRVKSGLGTNTA